MAIIAFAKPHTMAKQQSQPHPALSKALGESQVLRNPQRFLFAVPAGMLVPVGGQLVDDLLSGLDCVDMGDAVAHGDVAAVHVAFDHAYAQLLEAAHLLAELFVGRACLVICVRLCGLRFW